MFRPLSLKSQTPFTRFRSVFLALAVASALLCAASIVSAPGNPLGRSVAIVLSLGLAVYWIVGYRRGRFVLALEPFEAYALFLVLHVAPGAPFLPLMGLLFRCLYGGPLRACVRWVLFMGALVAAHDGRGPQQLQADLARAAGAGLVPVLGQALIFALRASETIQRRLTSIVENSTDVVT